MSQINNKTEEHKHHHHHSHNKYYYRQKDESSAMERKGENIIYTNVRKERIRLMIKRVVFCIISILLIAYTVYIMVGFDEYKTNKSIINKGYSTEEINEMKIKIIDYEETIEGLKRENEELKETLSKYEKHGNGK